MPTMIATHLYRDAPAGTEVEIDQPSLKPMVILGLVKHPPAEETPAAEYQRLTGRKPDGRWKADKLRDKIIKARYRRRDMRAED